LKRFQKPPAQKDYVSEIAALKNAVLPDLYIRRLCLKNRKRHVQNNQF
jgi:hypothetical protein